MGAGTALASRRTVRGVGYVARDGSATILHALVRDHLEALRAAVACDGHELRPSSSSSSWRSSGAGCSHVDSRACAAERVPSSGSDRSGEPHPSRVHRPSPFAPATRLPGASTRPPLFRNSSVTSGHGRSEGAFCPHLWNVDLRLTLTHPLSDEVAKLGAKRVAHGPYLVLQMAEVGVA